MSPGCNSFVSRSVYCSNGTESANHFQEMIFMKEPSVMRFFNKSAVVISGFVLMLVCLRPVIAKSSSAAAIIMQFTSMVGVDGSFVGHNPIRGVIGDELPWEVGRVRGSLTTDGHLQLSVRGVVFANDPSVPPNLRGINDALQFRALVSCLSGDGKGKVRSEERRVGKEGRGGWWRER